MSLSIQLEGGRAYLLGNTYPHRDAIRAIGGHWDKGRKMWWTTEHEKARALVAAAAGTPPMPPRTASGLNATVAGRVEYKGRNYYLAGRGQGVQIAPVLTRDATKYLLYFLDGSAQFWAACESVSIINSYHVAQTIQDVRVYALGANG